MKSTASPAFWAAYRALPAKVRRRVDRAYLQWRADPSARSLWFKPVQGKPPHWSVRIGGGYRAVGERHGDRMRWNFVASHPEYLLYIKNL